MAHTVNTHVVFTVPAVPRTRIARDAKLVTMDIIASVRVPVVRKRSAGRVMDTAPLVVKVDIIEVTVNVKSAQGIVAAVQVQEDAACVSLGIGELIVSIHALIVPEDVLKLEVVPVDAPQGTI